MEAMPDHDESLMPALAAAGLLEPGERPAITPLTGGVSSEVYRVDLRRGTICAKRALARLRVAAHWEAPLERSHSEVEWLRVAAAAGVTVPRVIAELPSAHVFFMDYLDPATHPVWKAELLAGRIDPAFAAAVGAALARIHGATHGRGDIAERFDTSAMFHALRIEPYLLFTAARHPDLADRLTALADRTFAARIALVHGDVSPKNILCGPAGPVLIDAECAWYGDPAFDLAFCLTHLLLKAVHRPQWAMHYRASFAALAEGYLDGAGWEPRAALEARAAELLAAFLLARVDGKSPAEYLTDAPVRERVRTAARALIAAPPATLTTLATQWLQRTGSR